MLKIEIMNYTDEIIHIVNSDTPYTDLENVIEKIYTEGVKSGVESQQQKIKDIINEKEKH